MTAIGLVLTLAFCLAISAVERRHAAIVFVASVLFITQGQAFEIAGVNFMAIRFVAVIAFLRAVVRGELRAINFSQIDRWLIISSSTYVVLLLARTATFDMYAIGVAIDSWLAYFSFRAFIQDTNELKSFTSSLVFLLIPFAALMTFESIQGRNLFATMGGVPETPVLREGHFRCQGSFRHAITAGSLGATCVPLFVALFYSSSRRLLPVLGIITCTLIVITSHSSGPLMAAVTGVAGWCCWYIRRNIRWVRRGIVAGLLVMHFATARPAWFIFDRISGVLGGDGWHRSNLIDQFIKHFDEWWLAGMPIENTGDWAATKMPWGGIDVTNHYVSLGLGGGLLSVVAFVTFLVIIFKHVGRTLDATRAGRVGYSIEPVIWGVGVMICVHAVNLSAVLYWDQFYVIWNLHLAIAASVTSEILTKPCRAAFANRSRPNLPANLPGFSA